MVGRGEATGEEESGSRTPERDSGHLLRDHLLDLWLHVSIHCFSCQRGNGDETQSLWKLDRGWKPTPCRLPPTHITGGSAGMRFKGCSRTPQ